MALIVFENATDAAKVIEQYKKNPEVEIMLDFLPNQAVVCIHAQISSMFLEKFKDKIGLQKGIETSSGVRVKEIPGRKWLLTGSLPQIHLAHKYLRNELTKIKSATEHSIQSQGTGKTPPQSTTAQTVDHANTLDISKSRRSQRSFNAESPSTGGSAFPSQKSNVNQLVIQMEEIQYEILLFFHSYWSGKELCRQFTYENGNLKLTGNKENIEKLESELTALLAEINRDQLKSQDLVFKDLLKNVKKREQLEVFVKYFENLDSCWLEFAGFSNEKINELKDNLVREIEKEKKAIESRKLPVAEGGTSVNEEPNNVQRFYTNENLEIKVYKGSITNLNVECIVSSNTRKLENFMGVAKAIANAAGPGFTEECKALVKAKGEIEKGFCCTTGPGKLPYRYVIHVVGPIWTAKSNSDVGSILKQSILSILKEATRLGVRSVALPAISAGQNHANKKLCTRIYAEAVCLFSSEQPQLKYSTLKEIHFIDRENGMVELIGKGFKEHFESNAFQTKVQVQRSSIGKPPVMSTVFKPYCQIRMMKGGQAEEYNLTEFFKVITWLGDILEFPHDYAVCCGQDSDFKSSSNIAKQFKSQQDVKKQISDIKKNQGPFRTGDVFQVKSKDCMIYYVIIKSFTERTRNMEEFLSDVTFCVKKTLCKAEESQEKAIAVPLLGTGNKGAQKSRATKAWIEGVLHFLRETFSKSSHHLREVYFVSSSQEDVATMASLFKQRIDSCKSVQSVVFDSFV
ncbi:protein mono-ADP-ribosyltransferase PARP9-like [Saccostrea cucullata]|uniref:protein mono-ADP-ribosyltransferase PARP9-like n=1 Tax=Saccostrea cuccullata TaxID=36930 RepID=UPI002ED648CA